jgi:hypothetical protein
MMRILGVGIALPMIVGIAHPSVLNTAISSLKTDVSRVSIMALLRQ